MNYPRFARVFSSKVHVAFLLIVSLLIWTTGLSLFFATASAATLTPISATASSSVPSANTNYTIQWTAISTVLVTQTIKITFDPGNSTFDLGALVATDVSTSGTPTNLTITTSACGGATPDQVSINGGISNSAGNKSITLTACGTIAAGTKTIRLQNNHVSNPSSPGTYKISVDGTQTDSGNTLVAIINQVSLTADVSTSFVFTVTGLASGQTVNGETTSTTSTATSIAYGLLASGTPIIAGQELSVTTNAGSGFIVTVKADQDLTSSAGAQIHSFKDGLGTATPVPWTAPSGTIANSLSYGHFGLTSDDADLNGGEFAGSKYAGNFSTTSRVVFSNGSAADGTTQNVGKARVAYKIQITDLQAAGSDYSNHLVYVCTPTF